MGLTPRKVSLGLKINSLLSIINPLRAPQMHKSRLGDPKALIKKSMPRVCWAYSKVDLDIKMLKIPHNEKNVFHAECS